MYAIWKRLLPKPMKKRAMVLWYNLLSKIDTGDELLFLNHGFAATQGDPKTLELQAEDEQDRYAIQLYHQLAVHVDWRDQDALEVSSGRGGGTAWLVRHFTPRSMIGLDIAKASTDFCRNRYKLPGLSFETGDAQAMPFPDERFDIVFNVESSLNYADFPAFLREVIRVLRPGGHFLICDYRRKNKVDRVKAQIDDAGFKVLSIDDITPHIVRGLELSEPQKVQVIEKYAPRFLRRGILQFARVSGGTDSERDLFLSGQKAYFSAVLQRPHESTAL